MPLGRAIESCRLQLRSWRPFGKALGSDSAESRGAANKRICRDDRRTSFPFSSVLDMSKLCFFDDDKPPAFPAAHGRSFARKRRRRGGSRSVSSRSSDRRYRSVGVSTANVTCSDFPMTAESTDSSGELFSEARWVPDESERNLRRDKEGNGRGEREFVISGYGLVSNCDIQGNESGYGSDSGYKGDVELEYGDELDVEEDDGRSLFWGDECGENTSQLEMIGGNLCKKGHHRCRRKKQDLRMT
ncbi:uncharacterized protein LOC130995365 [Salvia miltiorrhiza]|uniref:uncharacterized protein LOC130995365 n=1 Tax=Salvia miltiorrhiza TaxID=226208 RepID=UPI0025ACD067|nr:uncharacterized protein LOC130995365 [Salvia miltiorrhiza]